jgi:hypothetical protein
MIEVITTYLPTAIIAVSILAFIVSVIVEVTKGVKWLSIIPTDFEVLVLSIGLTVFGLVTYMHYMSFAITWYFVVGAILIGFFVAFVTMYGWEKLTALYKRFKEGA